MQITDRDRDFTPDSMSGSSDGQRRHHYPPEGPRPRPRRVGMAMDLAAVLDGKLPDQTGNSAWVVGMGARGNRPDIAAGAHVQEIIETISGSWRCGPSTTAQATRPRMSWRP